MQVFPAGTVPADPIPTDHEIIEPLNTADLELFKKFTEFQRFRELCK